jgi:hypothetical protein
MMQNRTKKEGNSEIFRQNGQFLWRFRKEQKRSLWSVPEGVAQGCDLNLFLRERIQDRYIRGTPINENV